MKSFQLSNCWQRRGKTPGERAKACAERSPRPSQPPAGPPICKPCQPLAHTAFRSRSEHAQLLAHEQLRPRPQTPTGPCFSPAVFVGPGWGLSAPASPSAMEQLGKRSGPAARLDTILRHLSPRLGAAPALVSFPMCGGKGGSGMLTPLQLCFPTPASFAQHSPHRVFLCAKEGVRRRTHLGKTHRQCHSPVPCLRGGDVQGGRAPRSLSVSWDAPGQHVPWCFGLSTHPTPKTSCFVVLFI